MIKRQILSGSNEERIMCARWWECNARAKREVFGEGRRLFKQQKLN
jgi:hypothetical protein